MPVIDALQTLLAHDRWATEQLLAACGPLTDEQLDRPFEMGRGSLRKILVHMLNVITSWEASLECAQESAALPEGSSIADLRAVEKQIASNFAAFVERTKDEPSLHAERRGRQIDIPPQAVFTHILTHGTHHRAQALNMLRHLGVSPLPQSSVMEWAIATKTATLE